jgi:hypothetical protein
MMEESEVKSSDRTKASIESYYSSSGVPKRGMQHKSLREQRNEMKKQIESADETRAFKRTLKRKTSNKVFPAGNTNIYDPIRETNLLNETSNILLDAVLEFLSANSRKHLSNPQLFEKIMVYFLMVLKTPQTGDFIVKFFATLR